MVDLRLITILPPQPVQGAQQTQIASGNLPQQTSLANFQAGSILSGFIINRDVSGNPILRTDSGDITFASNFFLKIGSEITIRIEHIAGNNTAHILSINGQEPELATLQSGFTQEPEVIVSGNLQRSVNINSNEDNNNPIITIKGTVIAPPQNTVSNTQPQTQPPLTTQTLPLPNGSQISLKIVNILPVPTNVIPSNQSIETIVTKPENFTLNNTTSNLQPQTTQTLSTQTPAQHTSSLPYSAYTRLNNPTTNNNPVLPAAIPQPQVSTQTLLQIHTQQIIASVISNNQDGETILQTPVGTLRLQTPTPLPLGSRIIFEIAEIQTPETLENTENVINPAATNNMLTSPAPLTQLARNTGSLSNIFTLITGLQTNDALNFINKNIPTIGQSVTGDNKTISQNHNILAPLLVFVSAIKSGDFREWLGRGNARWLENNGHETLLKKAEGEFLSISRQFTEPAAHQWQSLFFPIAVEGELQQVRLFVKRDRKQKENDGKTTNEEDTRFVLEMDLSQLGEMQMDGFVRRNSSNIENIQFDLIIRSHHELTPNIQKDIVDIYNSMGELTGYKGNLIFQTNKDFPVNPMEEIISDTHEGIIA